MDITVRPIKASEFEAFARISQTAYPGFYTDSKQDRIKAIEKIETYDRMYDLTHIGAFKENQLVGCMRFYVFEMHFHGARIQASGIGSVGVDLLHKKQHIAQAMIEYAHTRSLELGIPLTTLYPFDAGFYKNFGYGIGAPLYTYQVNPAHFKDFGIREGLNYQVEANFDALQACFNRYVDNHHGMMLKSSVDKFRINTLEKGRVLTFTEGDTITGYMVFMQENHAAQNFLRQKMILTEWIYNTPKALQAFSSFLHTQKDQVEYVEFFTFEPQFYQLLNNIQYVSDPVMKELISHKASEVSLGMMHRALDCGELIEIIEQQVPENIVFNITYPRTQEMESVEINVGYLERLEIDMPIDSFSSWIMGSVTLETLYMQGQLQSTRPEKLPELDKKFALKSPRCFNKF